MAFKGDGKNFSNTFNMGLPRPTPGICGALGVEPPGTSWMELINSAISTLDGHNHSGSGFGVPVPSAGIGINADLSFAGFNATSLRSTRYTPQALTSITAADVGCLLVSGADLYYVDTAGNQVRLTSAGGIAGTPGSISGLASPAAVTYTQASKLFAFTSSSGVAANLSAGPISIGDATVSGGKAATIGVPAGLAANYNLTLPSALPASTSLLSLSNAGAIGVVTYPLVAASIASGTLTTSQLSASAGILGSQLAANTVARAQLASVGQQVSASSGTFSTTSASLVNVTNLTVTITTTGRPVMVMVKPDGSGSLAYFQSATGAPSMAIARGGSVIAKWLVPGNTTGLPIALDTPVAGTYTYTVQLASSDASTVTAYNCVLVAYEL